MIKREITIQEIADQTGVSIATVSNVLNKNTGMVGMKTRERILETVKGLGYRPSRKAAQLRKKLNLTISFQIDSRISEDNIWRPVVLLQIMIIQGICSYAYSQSYHVNLIIPEKGTDMETLESVITRDDAIDGIILGGWQSESEISNDKIDNLLATIEHYGIKSVTIDHKIHQKGVPAISVNLRSGIRKACSRMSELKHKQVAYIGAFGFINPHFNLSRLDIFKEELKNVNIELPERNIYEAYNELGAYKKTIALIKSTPILPTCIIYGSDHMAMGGIEALQDCNIKVPDDVSVIGIDNAPYSAASPVALSSIDQKHRQQGIMLAKMLLDRINYPDMPLTSLSIIESDFIERGSLARAR